MHVAPVKLVFLSLLVTLSGLSVFAQAVPQNPKIISMCGIDQMSTTGQDTLVYYVANKFDDIFGSDTFTFLEIKTKLTDFFRGRLSLVDYEILEASLEEARLKLRDAYYCQALQCQRQAIDSLLRLYKDTLLLYGDAVFSVLNQEQITTIQQLFHQSLPILERKKQEFLDYEPRFSNGEKNCAYDYLDFGFDLMRRIPCSNYYNLLGVDMSGLSFVDSIGLERYYRIYAEFEIALTRVLAHEGCKAHAAIPFFVESRDDNSVTVYRKRNALFFIVAERVDSILPAKQTRQFPVLDTIQMESWNDDDLVLEEIINDDALKELGFEHAPSYLQEVGTVTFMNPHSMELFGLTLSPTTADKLGTLRDMNKRIRQQEIQRITVGKLQLYFAVETDEVRDASKSFAHIDGIILSENEMVILFLMGADPKGYLFRLEKILEAVKL